MDISQKLNDLTPEKRKQLIIFLEKKGETELAERLKETFSNEEFLKKIEIYQTQIKKNLGQINDQRLWSAFGWEDEIERLDREMANPNISSEEWERLDRKQDKAYRELYRELGYWE